MLSPEPGAAIGPSGSLSPSWAQAEMEFGAAGLQGLGQVAFCDLSL